MTNDTKIWLIIATALLVTGGIVFVTVMSFRGWDFSGLDSGKYEENVYEVDEDFDSIEINSDTADITLLPSEDGKFKAVCYEKKNKKHTFGVTDGILVSQVVNKQAWYDHIFNFGTDKMTLYLPKAEYSALVVKSDTSDLSVPKDFGFTEADISVTTGDVRFLAAAGKLKITATTGDISLEGLSADAVELSVSTGNVTAASVSCKGNISVTVSTGDTVFSDLTCGSLTSRGSTGNIILRGVVASGGFSVERSTGDVIFDGCDAAEIYAKTTTGNITGTLLSEKIFLVETSTGRRDVPKSTKGGRCELYASTGDIIIAYKTK